MNQIYIWLVIQYMYLNRGTGSAYLSSYQSHSPNSAPSADVKDNSLMSRGRNTIFKSNHEIMHYLKLFGTDMMIWRCKNALQPYWEWQPIPVIDLDCETIGVVSDVEWYHNDQKIDLSLEHYSQTIKAHNARGQFYSSWLDFNLKIYNATVTDAGMYSFKARSGKGFTNWQNIYVDISKQKNLKRTKKNKKKRSKDTTRKRNRRKLRKLSRKYGGLDLTNEYNRFYLFHKYHRARQNKPDAKPKEIKTGKNTYYII